MRDTSVKAPTSLLMRLDNTCQEYVVSIRKELQPRSMGSSGSLQGN